MVPGVAIPARAGEWMSHASDGTIAIMLGNDLVSRGRADAACSRVRGFGKTKADLLAPNGHSAISDRFGNLNAYSRCSFAADSQEESFLVNFRLYSSLAFSEGTVVGTHMQALLPKLRWPEAHRASCSGRQPRFYFAAVIPARSRGISIACT
jgi:hypothetical protein